VDENYSTAFAYLLIRMQLLNLDLENKKKERR
jgi:hypothetical protein